MKFLILSLLVAMPVWARQYTQCSSEGFYAVVNLPSKEQGTLFLTAGAETDENILVNLALQQIFGQQLVYQLESAGLNGKLLFPLSAFGTFSNDLSLELQLDGTSYELSCFTRSYEE